MGITSDDLERIRQRAIAEAAEQFPSHNADEVAMLGTLAMAAVCIIKGIPMNVELQVSLAPEMLTDFDEFVFD